MKFGKSGTGQSVRAAEVKALLMAHRPEGALVGGYDLSSAEADALIKRWRSLLGIRGLTIWEIALHMVEWGMKWPKPKSGDLKLGISGRRTGRHGNAEGGWVNGGFSSSAGMHIQYATNAAYPGVQRVTARYTAEPEHVAYVVSGQTREFKSPESAARAAERAAARDQAWIAARIASRGQASRR